jgi:hypothetical protein
MPCAWHQSIIFSCNSLKWEHNITLHPVIIVKQPSFTKFLIKNNYSKASLLFLFYKEISVECYTIQSAGQATWAAHQPA